MVVESTEAALRLASGLSFSKGMARTAESRAAEVVSALVGLKRDGALFYAMELLDGIDLQKLVERFGPMPRAIGTTAALCLPMAVFGIAGFVLSPTPAECPSGCTGYVYLPAVAATGISAASPFASLDL